MKKLPLDTETSSRIINELMHGKPLTSICKSKDMPSLSKVYNWIQTEKSFADKIITARRIGAQTYLDKMVEELENCSHKDAYIINLKLQHYRWLASKLLSIYGDKQEIKQDTNISISWNIPEQKTFENEINITPGPKLHTLAKENPDKSYKELEKIRADSSVAETH
jgi:hypothetical protein|tara:strand:- start:200 stop:697 length:498 start_codon:yes stop_codon:yes gene_type:complete